MGLSHLGKTTVKRNTMDGLSVRGEGYIETIHELIKEHGYAAVTDIATALNVKPPSVTRMIQKLDTTNFVKYTPYRTVVLTHKGKSLAKTLEKRHNILKEFLKMIGVDENIAEEDACRIEHIAHKMTMKKLTEFVEFVQKAPRSPRWLQHFKHFKKTGKYPECRDDQSS